MPLGLRHDVMTRRGRKRSEVYLPASTLFARLGVPLISDKQWRVASYSRQHSKLGWSPAVRD